MVDGMPSWLGFLRLMQTGAAVTGYLLVVQPGEQGTTVGQTVSVQGNTDGDAITLVASSLFNLANLTLSGSLQCDGRLILTAPTSSGYVQTLPFVPPSQNAFNAAVSAWQQDLGSAYARQRQAEGEATAQVERQIAVVSANAHLSAALSALTRDTAQLKRDSNFTAVLKAYGSDWTRMEAEWQKEQKDAGKRPFDCTQLGVVQSDLGTVQSDLGSIQSDAGAFQAVQAPVTSDDRNVSRDMQAVTDASNALQSASTLNTTGVPAPAFGATVVAEAIRGAQEQTTSSTDALQQAQAQAGEFDKEAARLAATARQFVATLKC